MEDEPAVARRVDVRHAAAEPEVPPRPPVLSRAAVRAMRAEAVQAWSATMGDATSCALAKDGRSYPAGKYHEGRVAALGELMRRLTPDSDAAEALAAARELADAWSSRVQPGGGANREWESYRAGGVHALAEVAEP
ncbi:hypothetical protein [Agromyces sp. ZXT2-6]|uniref:hypothetical protein n=1 Tax=Agromyces sp. ZXT2-6 TaxID=3461153 RepID=UPI004054A7FB